MYRTSVASGLRFDRANHEIFRRVLAGDKLDNICAVPHDLQNQHAETICQDIAKTFFQNTLAQHWPEGYREGLLLYLLLEMMMATGNADQQAATPANALRKRLICGGITGMQGENNVRRDTRLKVDNRAVLKGQMLPLQLSHFLLMPL